MSEFLTDKSQWITFIAGLITAIVSGIALKSSEDIGISKRTIAMLTLICGMLTAIGSLFSNEDSAKKNEKLSIKSDSIKILSQNNSCKLDSSIERLDLIIQKSESQYKKLTLVQKEITENYDKINNGYYNLINKANNLKYLISDDFLAQLEIEFTCKPLTEYFDILFKNKYTSNLTFIFASSENFDEISANTIRYKYNNLFVSISIFNKAENYSPQNMQFKKDIRLHSDFLNFSKIPIKPTNTPKLLEIVCTYNYVEKRFIIRIDNMPLKIFSNWQYKSLNEFKKSDISVSVNFNEDLSFKDKGLNIKLDYDYTIRQLVLYHNSNFILNAEKFNKQGNPQFKSFAKFD